MTTERLVFSNPRGEELAARLELPEGAPRAFAIFAHCFTCSKDVAAATRVARALGKRGLAVLRFDFTGLGGSDGDFANTNFSSNVQDLLAAAAYLEEHHQAPRLLIGHSLGGAAVLSAAADLSSVQAVATIGAPAEPQHVRHLLLGEIDEIEREGRAKVRLAGRDFTIKREFLEDLDEQRLSDRIRRMGSALLVLHSPQDEIVGIDNARRIYQAAVHPKSFLTLDGADHMLSKREDSEYAAEVIAAWSSRYLETEEMLIGEAERELPDGTVRVTERNGGLAQTVRAGRHTLAADEPLSFPTGTDTGPTPYDYLLASLGACTSMTLRMYARHKGWALEGFSVDLRHSRVHAEDCERCEESGGRLDRFERDIHITGDLDDAQRARLMEIADRCPVHRTLLNEKDIPTRLV